MYFFYGQFGQDNGRGQAEDLPLAGCATDDGPFEGGMLPSPPIAS